MPDFKALRPGDLIRILSVPQADVEQWQSQTAAGDPDADWTYRVLRKMAEAKEKVASGI